MIAKSIFSRIIFLHVIALLITAIFLPLVLYWFVKATADHVHRQAMREQADLVAGYLAARPDGGLTLDLPPALQAFYSPAYGRYAFAVLDDTGKVLFSSRAEQAPIFANDPRTFGIAFLEAQRGNAEVAGVSMEHEVGARKVWIEVGEDLAHRDVIIDDIVADFKRAGFITLPMLLFLLGVDIIIFRRALHPLIEASEMAAHINPRRTDVRLPPDGIPKEILPLVQAINQALDRLEGGFRAQREFTADAAHELRTPLTILRGRIDTLPDRTVAKALHRDIEGMARIVSQLLDIAELETLSVDAQDRADLRAISCEVAEVAAPLALAQGKNVALSGADAAVWVRGNADMLTGAIRNLVENAINYSRPTTTVEIVVDESGTVRVLDEGPGIKPEERELIFQRFWRRDRRRAGSAGLGLAIVQRVAEAHGTAVGVEDRPGGGTIFSLKLVRADADQAVPGAVPAACLGSVTRTASNQDTHNDKK